MKMLLEQIWKLIPPTQIGSAQDDAIMSTEEIHRRRLALVSGFGLLATAGITIAHIFLLPFDLAASTTIAASLLGFAICSYSLYMGLWGEVEERMLRVLLVIFSAITWLEVFLAGGITGYNAAILPVFPVVAALLLRARDAVLFTVMHMLVIFVIAGLYHSQNLPFALSADSQPNLPIAVAILLVTVVACAGGALYMAFQNEKVEGQLRELLIHQAYLAVHDYLSGLGNRVQLQQRFANSREGDEFDVLLIDLDGFKAVNDVYGHEAGDYLIKTVSARLRELTEDNDFVVRLGGDEFVILLEGVDGSPADVRKYGDFVIKMISQPYPWRGQILRISASIGHARYPLHAETPSKVLGLADKSLYVAKEAGKGICVTHGEPPVKPVKRRKRPFVLPTGRNTRFVD